MDYIVTSMNNLMPENVWLYSGILHHFVAFSTNCCVGFVSINLNRTDPRFILFH